MELHKVIDKDKDFYWPHRSEQEEKARILFGRIKAWKMAMDVVHNYFKGIFVSFYSHYKLYIIVFLFYNLITYLYISSLCCREVIR